MGLQEKKAKEMMPVPATYDLVIKVATFRWASAGHEAKWAAMRKCFAYITPEEAAAKGSSRRFWHLMGPFRRRAAP